MFSKLCCFICFPYFIYLMLLVILITINILYSNCKQTCYLTIIRYFILYLTESTSITIIKSLHIVKFVSRLTMLIEKYLAFLSGVVLVQCMQCICNFETMLRKNIYGFMQKLDHSTNTIIRNLYQSWI